MLHVFHCEGLTKARHYKMRNILKNKTKYLPMSRNVCSTDKNWPAAPWSPVGRDDVTCEALSARIGLTGLIVKHRRMPNLLNI